MDDLFKSTGWSKKQLEVLTYPDVSHLFLCGAARGGKTYCSIVRFIYKLLDVKKYRDDCAIITKTYDTFKRNFLSPLTKILDPSLYHYSNYKKTINICGVLCWVIPANDKRFDDKIKGATLSALYIDELTTLSPERWWLANTRMAKEYSMIISTSNPDAPTHYVKKEILDVEKDNPDFKYFHFVLDDNPSLTEKDKEKFKAKFRGAMYDRYILGKWVKETGLVYDFDLKEYTIQDSPTIPEKYFIGLDFGIMEPFAAILFAENNDGSPKVWACDEIYFASSAMDQQQKTPTEYAHMIDKKWGHLQAKIEYVYLDYGNSRMKDVLEYFGYRTHKVNPGALAEGIQLVSDMMYSGEYKILRKLCKRLVEEKGSYSWKDSAHNKENVVARDCDAVDAERFALHARYNNVALDEEEQEPFRHGLIHNAAMREMSEGYGDYDEVSGHYRVDHYEHILP